MCCVPSGIARLLLHKKEDRQECSNIKGLRFDLDSEADEAIRQNDHTYSVGSVGRKLSILIKCNETHLQPLVRKEQIFTTKKNNQLMEFQYPASTSPVICFFFF